MKAIALNPQKKSLELIEVPEPSITHDDEVKLRVLEVGICGTDREEAEGKYGEPPPGQENLIIGHEMLGEITEIGSAVKYFRKGDLAIFTVRRGCEHCPACLVDNADMCYSGDYTERGIKGRHGFQSEYIVDKEKYLVKVPHTMREYAVLCEPTSVVEKAIDQIREIQTSRLKDWAAVDNCFRGKKAVVAGLGPIGLLASIVLRLCGCEVFGIDRVDKNHPRVKILERIEGKYFDSLEKYAANVGCADIIIEAAGVVELDFQLFNVLGANGIYVLTGIPAAKTNAGIDGGTILREMVLKNQVLVGSVNARKKHWEKAISDLAKAEDFWEGVLKQLITSHVPFTDFKAALEESPHFAIKTVISWVNK